MNQNKQKGQKFLSLCKGFLVVLESKFDKTQSAGRFLKEGVSTDDILFSHNLERGQEEKLGQIWHPGEICVDGNNDEFVAFKIVTNGLEKSDDYPPFMLVFQRRGCLAVCARFNDEQPYFGFENKSGYLPLGFPGISGKFNPLFVKIRPAKKSEYDEFFLKIVATEHKEDDEEYVIVVAVEIGKKDVPQGLLDHTFDSEFLRNRQ